MILDDVLYPVLCLGGLGLLFGILLGFASRKFAVKVDPRIARVREALPGANCGGCGYAGCDAYAEAVVNGEAPPDRCSAGGAATAKSISSLMGLSVGNFVPRVAFVTCRGRAGSVRETALYEGVSDCRQASVVPGGGSMACQHGCLGLGSCVDVCPFGAIAIEDGVARVDESKCGGCGACAAACPRGVIQMVPKKWSIRVACNSVEPGAAVRKDCSVGCIGCGLCAKFCPEEAITMVDNLPRIDHEKCAGCGICMEKCPVGAIVRISDDKSVRAAG